jgi:hypothetical protein
MSHTGVLSTFSPFNALIKISESSFALSLVLDLMLDLILFENNNDLGNNASLRFKTQENTNMINKLLHI